VNDQGVHDEDLHEGVGEKGHASGRVAAHQGGQQHGHAERNHPLAVRRPGDGQVFAQKLAQKPESERADREHLGRLQHFEAGQQICGSRDQDDQECEGRIERAR
jgi:hypothetical protein